jgi:outer membrane protein insertion porin family
MGISCGQWRRSAGAAALLAVVGLNAATALANEASAQPQQRIDVVGNRRIDAETVRSYFRALPDGRFDDAARDAALKALLATGLFDKVTIDGAGDGLVVHLTEARLLDRVAFEGNKKIKDQDLTAVVQSRARGTLQRAAVQADVGRIMEAYRHAGRNDVGVVPQIIERGNERVDLVFAITEGRKTPIRQINFEGIAVSATASLRR